MSIQEHLNKIRNAIYGREVRESIAKGIETAYDDASENGNANMEVKLARGANPNLNTRLNKMDETDRQTTAQLAQKIDKGNVLKNDLNKNSIRFDETWMTDEFIAQFVENTQPIHAIPAPDSIIESMLANNGVTAPKVDFVDTVTSTNLFSTVKMYRGQRLTNEGLTPVSGNDTTYPIPINSGAEYTLHDVTYFAWSDINGNRIGGVDWLQSRDPLTVTSPANARFIQVTNPDSFRYPQINRGNTLLEYEPPKLPTFRDIHLGVDRSDFNGRVVHPDNTLFLDKTSNLFDRNRLTVGYGYRTGSDELQYLEGNVTTQHIRINSGYTYTFVDVTYVAWFEEGGNWLKTDAITGGTIGTKQAPDNAYTLRATTHLGEFPYPQINEGFKLLNYTPYSYEPANNVGNTNGREIILPPTYPILAGEEGWVYMDNILKNGNYYTSEKFIPRNKGDVFSGGLKLAASSVYKEHINFDYYQGDSINVSDGVEINKVSRNSGNGKNVKILIIGESTSNNPYYPTELERLFNNDVMDVEMLGSRGTGTARHEAKGGTRTDEMVSLDYFDDGEKNHLVNGTTGKFDFANYMSEQGYTSVDYVFINMGLNDIFEGNTINETIANYQLMIDNIRDYDNTINFIIGLSNLPTRFENQRVANIGFKDDMLDFISNLIDVFGNRENEGFFLAPYYLNIDPYWDMQYEEIAISTRNPKTTFIGADQYGGNHPSEIGYYKMADVSYWTLKYAVTQ